MITEAICTLLAGSMLMVGTPALPLKVQNRVNEAITAKETATKTDLELVAKIVWLEGRGESPECQRAITETIYNRLQSEIWGDTVEEVIYAKTNGYYEYSTVHDIDTAVLDDDIYEIVEDVFENGSEIDERIMYFRADYYHAWANAEFSIDNTYFSSSPWYQ